MQTFKSRMHEETIAFAACSMSRAGAWQALRCRFLLTQAMAWSRSDGIRWHCMGSQLLSTLCCCLTQFGGPDGQPVLNLICSLKHHGTVNWSPSQAAW
eukprot:3818048-Amphidinium_carterae.1